MKRRRSFTSTDTSVLLQLMGISSESYFDPSMAVASWGEVDRRLDSHPMDASICAKSSIFYPLKLALMNERTPCPAHVVEKLIRCFPSALSIDDFACACRYKHTTGEVMRIILKYLPQCQERDYVKRWDLDWIAVNKNSGAGLVLIDRCEAANPKNIQQWRNLTHPEFWLSCLLKRKSRVVTEEKIREERILQFFIKQGNVECVKLILDAYPKFLRLKCCIYQEQCQLPIHFALFADDKDLAYEPWHHRSEIVRLLLKKGCEAKIGGPSGCGGLLPNGLNYALNAVLNSRWNDDEKIKSLQVCLQFAQAHMYDVSFSDVNQDFPLLHAALGVLQVDSIVSIMSKIGIDSLCVDRNGRTAIFALAELVVNRPKSTYIAVHEKVSEEKKRLVEYFSRLRSMNRDTENRTNEQDVQQMNDPIRMQPHQRIHLPLEAIPREMAEDQMNNLIRINPELVIQAYEIIPGEGGEDLFDENHLTPVTFCLPTSDELGSKYESEMITSLFQLLLKDEVCTHTNPYVTNAAAVKDKDDRVAIHFACEIGLPFEKGLSKIINRHHEGLLECDGLTGLFPYELAATSGNLELTFKVLLEEPSVLVLRRV